MKNFNKKTIIFVSAILLSLLTFIGFGAHQVQAQDVYDIGDGSKSVAYTSIENIYGEHAPTYDDEYLFAGWYEDAECTTSYIKKDGETLDTYYAKFVPKEVLSVKAQHRTGLHNWQLTDETKGGIRFITAVDSVNYKKIGFLVSGTIGTKVFNNEDIEIKTVYDKLYYVDTSSAEPVVQDETAQTTFGTESAKLFAPFTFIIKYSQFDDDFTITPYWETPDGVIVTGEPRTRSMIDNLEDNSYARVNERGFYTYPSLNTLFARFTTLEIVGTDETPTVITLLKDVELTAMLGINGYTKITNKSGTSVTISKADTWSGEGLSLLSTNKNILVIEGADASRKDNITIDGGEAKSLIVNNSTLILKNATLKDGHYVTTTKNLGGGAIDNAANSIYQITNCRFENNKSDMVGGAIRTLSTSSSSYIRNSEFSSNKAETFGGAISSFAGASTDQEPSLNIEGCTFVSNTCTGMGGALYLQTKDGKGQVTSSTFYSNEAGTNGGVVACSVATLTMTDCSFNTVQNETTVGNTAKTNGGLAYVNGGGTLSILTTLTGLSFDGNTDKNTRALVAVNPNGGTSTIEYSSSYGENSTNLKTLGNVIVATK